MLAASFITILKTGIIAPLIKLLLAASVIYFLWGVFMFMQNREDEDKKKHLLWGTIGLAVVVSAAGIVNLIGSFVSTVAGKGG